ncbi:hypothetical protein LTR62_001003 [Meristemomyces frigidus]|uniref:Uncharacterized protein n=1 Tax=Meristemomyces frigidus TaxID=1508187 RepID=A0AAN7YBZ1_9PEZI|nr:hypothetical protein LTR62_001003 [Meristemomyces frigidus]
MKFTTLFARSETAQPAPTHTVMTLIVVLLVLLLVMLALIASLLFMRQRRRAQRSAHSLPTYNEKHLSTSSTTSHRRVMVRPSESIYVSMEKQALVNETSVPASPTTSVPEIRITFPEEFDESGKSQSGRVVVVRVGETSIGLEPVVEKLPAYEVEGRFQSVDLERVGGLVEKARNAELR